MRLRHIKGAEEEIAESPYVVQDPQSLKGRWHEFFGNDNPIRIEVGMGKGKFISYAPSITAHIPAEAFAQMNPDINYVGIERYSSVLLRGLQKRAELELSNIYFMRIDALELTEVFAENEVERIYLNFSDPWPKDRHAKRRLTSDRFLAVYDKILQPDGIIEFKTDNQDLFRYSLESIPEAGWQVTSHTFDLHHSDMAEGNVMTEYETKFSAEGKPICKLTACRDKS